MKAKRLEVTRVTKKGQVVIPKMIRDKLHLEEGTSLGVEVTDKGVIMMKEIEVPFEKDDLKAIDKFWEDVESNKLKLIPASKFLEDFETW
ncbi:MAG: AbrB/MazE/SpoVT family DNA-binding domain-containing protein [Candidatus Hydrothermarchaeales archaeon]